MNASNIPVIDGQVMLPGGKRIPYSQLQRVASALQEMNPTIAAHVLKDIEEQAAINAIFDRDEFIGRPKVAVFGSARTALDHANENMRAAWKQNFELGKLISQRNWVAVHGAGPGQMDAVKQGAGLANHIGVKLTLPHEPAHDGDPNVAETTHFRVRQPGLMYRTHGYICTLPGGGTVSEATDVMTWVQTGQTSVKPLVLLNPPHNPHLWNDIVPRYVASLQAEGTMANEDDTFFDIVDTPEDAIDQISSFYRNFDSIESGSVKSLEGRPAGFRVRLRGIPTNADMALLSRSNIGTFAKPIVRVETGAEARQVLANGGIAMRTIDDVWDYEGSPKAVFEGLWSGRVSNGDIRLAIDVINNQFESAPTHSRGSLVLMSNSERQHLRETGSALYKASADCLELHR